MKTKATVIVFFSNKGGTGKTKHAIQTANCLGAAGYHVLFIDMDFNDSATKFYITSATEEAAITKNTFEAMKNEGGRLEDFSLETERSGVRFIPSSRYLCDLRGVSERRLSHIAPSANGAYDYVIIDCAPSYDNLSLNAIHAANFIITPVMLDLDNYTAAEFLNGKILSETDKSGCWFLTVTKYNRQFSDSKSGKQKTYLDYFMSKFSNFTPTNTWFPETNDLTSLKDYKKFITGEKADGARYVCNPSLYDAVCNLSECFIEEDETFVRPKFF